MFMVELTVDSHYSVLGLQPDAHVQQIRDARDRMVEDLRIRQRREPGNRDAYLAEQDRINRAAEELARPARREQYDRAHPHLRFFTVRNAAAPMFVSLPDRVAALRAAIAAHLDALGAPPDRYDFTADFTRTALLDEPARPGGDERSTADA
jgi:curved DNA-binding protein CbpA